MVALLVAPALGAQERGRWEDRDQRDRGRWEDRDNDRDGGYRRRNDVSRLFTFNGAVDNDTRIYIRGRDVRTRTVSGADVRRARIDEDNPLPRRDGTVRVQLMQGRGSVYVIQQPNASNDYTAIVRVKDSQGGSDRYRFAVYFDPSDYGYGRGPVYGDGRGPVYGDDRGPVYGDGRGPVWGDNGNIGYGGRVLHWSGSVDDDLRISLQRGQVGYSVASGQRPMNVQSSGGALPRRDGHLEVSLRQGRGAVQVIEQPTSYNNYTAVVRVLDRQGGYGYYDFDLIWR